MHRAKKSRKPVNTDSNPKSVPHRLVITAAIADQRLQKKKPSYDNDEHMILSMQLPRRAGSMRYCVRPSWNNASVVVSAPTVRCGRRISGGAWEERG
jgi:hypothetical protein